MLRVSPSPRCATRRLVRQPLLRGARAGATGPPAADVAHPRTWKYDPGEGGEAGEAAKEEVSLQEVADFPCGVCGQHVVLAQSFDWSSCRDKRGWYNVVRDDVPRLVEAGVTHAWLPPPSHSVSPQGYLPGRLYDLNSAYGTKEELQRLLQVMNKAGVTPLADIVINHRCADLQGENGTWNIYSDDIDHDGRKIDWGRWAITCDDPSFQGSGNPDTGAAYAAAPDLDHANPALRHALIDWMRHLRSLGFGGWRLDFVKGYAPSFTAEYVRETVGEGAFCVGENWVDLAWREGTLLHNQDVAREKLRNWIVDADATCMLFDFVTKGLLQEAVRNTEFDRLVDGQGRPAGLLGVCPAHAVTFIDNHDTGGEQCHWPFPTEKLMVGYAYILTHPGVPCVFWDHMFQMDLFLPISDLIGTRKRNGIFADSSVEVLCADADLYVAKIESALIVKLGPKFDMGALFPRPEEGWQVACCGNDFCVWERA